MVRNAGLRRAPRLSGNGRERPAGPRGARGAGQPAIRREAGGMKDLSEIFSNLEGTNVELNLAGHGPEGSTLVETGRVLYSGTDYVAIEPRRGEEPHFIPFLAIRSFRALRS